MKQRKVGAHTEYYQDIKYICGCVVNTITLDYKLPKHEIARLKNLECPHCRHMTMLYSEV